MLILSGTFTAKSDAVPALLELAATLMPLSRAEPGCLKYDLLRVAHAPDQFVFFEMWKSRADLDEHFQKPYFKLFAEEVASLIVGDMDIQTYETPGPTPAF